MGLLHAPGGRGTLAGCLGGQLLARSLSSGGLTGGLLGTGHAAAGGSPAHTITVKGSIEYRH